MGRKVAGQLSLKYMEMIPNYTTQGVIVNIWQKSLYTPSATRSPCIQFPSQCLILYSLFLLVCELVLPIYYVSVVFLSLQVGRIL